jgi:hypothetical protein
LPAWQGVVGKVPVRAGAAKVWEDSHHLVRTRMKGRHSQVPGGLRDTEVLSFLAGVSPEKPLSCG